LVVEEEYFGEKTSLCIFGLFSQSSRLKLLLALMVAYCTGEQRGAQNKSTYTWGKDLTKTDKGKRGEEGNSNFQVVEGFYESLRASALYRLISVFCRGASGKWLLCVGWGWVPLPVPLKAAGGKRETQGGGDPLSFEPLELQSTQFAIPLNTGIKPSGHHKWKFARQIKTRYCFKKTQFACISRNLVNWLKLAWVNGVAPLAMPRRWRTVLKK
jgi:hypothetical protein